MTKIQKSTHPSDNFLRMFIQSRAEQFIDEKHYDFSN